MTETGTLILAAIQRATGRIHDEISWRDRSIVHARAEGVPVAKIAEAAGMTGPGVRAVLRRMGTK